MKSMPKTSKKRLRASTTELYANVLSRTASSDGFATFRGRLAIQGMQVGAYPGHRASTTIESTTHS